MSELVSIGKAEAAAPAPSREAPKLPYTLSLSSRYYSRMAIEETARDFAEIAKVETRVGDGQIDLTFQSVDPEAGPDVIDEFLNHCLYRSATSGGEGVSP